MSSPYQGRQELGQNFLCDGRVVADIVRIVSHTTGPIIEIGAGDGALTVPLSRLGRGLTAQWWPWFEFHLVRKVSADAFRPRPSVDTGLLTITRRREPLIADADRRRYQALVHGVFTGRGRGMAQIVGPQVPRHWLRHNGIKPSALPRDLTATQWAALFEATG